MKVGWLVRFFPSAWVAFRFLDGALVDNESAHDGLWRIDRFSHAIAGARTAGDFMYHGGPQRSGWQSYRFSTSCCGTGRSRSVSSMSLERRRETGKNRLRAAIVAGLRSLSPMYGNVA